jgi:NAD dependent epimerase/dehydratase
MTVESLNGRQVLVTGADGFIGSHLVEELVKAGANVRALVFYNSWNHAGWLGDIGEEAKQKVKFFLGDVRDPQRMVEAVEGCSYVYHLASLIAIPYSYRAPHSFVETNILGTLNVLEACRRSTSLVRMVHTSTSEVYGTAQTVPISENHPLVGQSPYSASKIGADKIVESFHLSFGTPVVTARPFNTFGPRQTARAVIPTIASQLLAGCEQLKLGALLPTRDFNFVTDTVRGMIALSLCEGSVGRVVNIGSGEEWSIRQTAEMLMDIVGRKVPIICEAERTRPERSEVNRLLADNRLISSLTDWRSVVPFVEGLKRTAAWIDQNASLFRASEFAV